MARHSSPLRRPPVVNDGECERRLVIQAGQLRRNCQIQFHEIRRLVVSQVFDKVVNVNEGDGIVPSGAMLRDGDYIQIVASGQIWAGVWFTPTNGPGGWNNLAMDSKFPMPRAHAYSLLGTVDAAYFEIGWGVNQFYRRADGDATKESELMLTINDDIHGNGSGGFTVHVQVYRNDAATAAVVNQSDLLQRLQESTGGNLSLIAPTPIPPQRQS